MVKQPALTALLLTSIVALTMCAFRTIYTGTYIYAYMGINLVLAWVPFFLSMVIPPLMQKRRGGALFIMGFLWLLFFPNTFYMVTDFVHLTSRPPIPIWFDAVMLTLFALAGVALGFISLYIVDRALKKYLPDMVFSVAMLITSSLGIYIGRFLRWNSWDFLTHPAQVLINSAFFLRTPGAVGFIAIATMLTLVLYRLFLPHLERAVKNI